MQSRFGEMMNSSTYCIDVQGRRIIVDVRPSVCVHLHSHLIHNLATFKFTSNLQFYRQ